MKAYLIGTLVAIGIPLVWKLLPGIGAKISGPINDAWKSLLRKTKPYWKGHAVDIDAIIDEASKEAKQDVDEVDKEP